MVGNVVSQGVGNLTGAQKGFSWSSVAISAVGATAGAYASDKLGLNIRNLSPGQDLGRAAVNAGANALAQITIRGGKVNWQQVATDTILNFSQSRLSSLVAEQRAVQGNANDDPTYSTRPKGSFTQELLSSSQVEAAAINDKPNFNGLRASYVDSPEQLNAKNGGLNASYGDALGNGVVYGKEQYMKGMPNAVVNKEAENATRQVKSGVSSAPKNNGVNAEVQAMINQVQFCNSAVTCADTSTNLMTRAGIYSNAYTWAQSKGDFNAANTYLGLAAAATALSSQASQKMNITVPSKIPYEISTSRFVAGWNTGEYSAGLSGMSPIDVRSIPEKEASYARTGKFILGTAMIATGVGIYGLPTLGAFGTGATIGAGTNASVQYINSNGFTTKPFNMVDATYGGITSGLTMGLTIIPSLAINTGGAISSSAFSTDTAYSSAAGAVAGTSFGAGVGFGLDSTLNYLPNNKYTEPTKAVIKVLKPVLSGAAGGFFGNAVKDKASQ